MAPRLRLLPFVILAGLGCALTTSSHATGDAPDAATIRVDAPVHEASTPVLPPGPVPVVEGATCAPAGRACELAYACVSCASNAWTIVDHTRCSCRSGRWVCEVDADCFGFGPNVYLDPACTVPSVRDAGAPVDAPPGPPWSDCDAYLANHGHDGDRCQPGFVTCQRPFGAGCCRRVLRCEDGVIVDRVDCDDDCDQACHANLSAGDCALQPGCEWFRSTACGPAPPGSIAGPACIPQRGGPCDIATDCAAGQQCTSFWINPCEGLPCTACGGTERRCVAPI
jgi:hypothetical protein